MLFAGWEVQVVKKKTVTKKMLHEATDQGQHFQHCGHSFFTVWTEPNPANKLFMFFLTLSNQCFN